MTVRQVIIRHVVTETSQPNSNKLSVDKIIPSRAMKAYEGSEGVPPFNINLGNTMANGQLHAPAALLNILLTYTLTAWSGILLEKLTGSQPVKKFPTFYGTRRFISAFTRARHLSLS